MTTGYRRLLLECMTTHVVIIVISGLCRYVQTAEVGDLRLVDGLLPNMGRVEIFLGDRGWFTTCDPTWDINDAIVVCRQLGFPGAAFARADSNYRAIGIPLARSVKCTGYESRLLDCPYHTTELCTSAVGVVCQGPGYVGCYADEPSDSMFHDGHTQSHVMDLSECKAFCRLKKARYVGLKNTKECYCGKTAAPLPKHEKLKDSECQMPCAGNQNEICGGVSTKGNYVVSVHNMSVGDCRPLASPLNGYILDTDFSYGEVVRYQCITGFVLVGSKAIRCVFNGHRGRQRVAWNASAPVCVAKPSSPLDDDRVWLPTRGTTGKLLADKPGLVLVVALIVVLALVTPAFIFVVLRRHCIRRKMLNDAKGEKNSYQDLLYNPSYELSSGPYEPLRPPRRRDALRHQKTKTAPSALDIDTYTNTLQHQQGIRKEAYTCNSMRNLIITNGDVPKQTSLRNEDTSNFRNEDNQIYSNENTLNFRNQKERHRFSREDMYKLKNEDKPNNRNEDDTHNYAVAI